MPKRILEVYSFRVQKYGKNDKFENLSKLENNDLLEVIFTGFPNFVDSVPANEEDKTHIQFSKTGSSDKLKTVFHKLNDARIIYGKVSTGQYGKEDDVIDITRKEKLPILKINHNQAVIKPFFFLLFVPNDKDTGFLVLEREGQHGIKVIFTDIIRKFINQKFNRYYTEFYNVIDQQLIKDYVEKGDMHSIVLTRNSLPGDIADKYGLGKYDTDDFKIELTITAKGKSFIPSNAKTRLKNAMDRSSEGFFTDKSFKNIGFSETADIKVRSNYKHSTRTIDLSDTMKFRPYYIVDAKLDSSGYSDIVSIKDAAINLLKELNIKT